MRVSTFDYFAIYSIITKDYDECIPITYYYTAYYTYDKYKRVSAINRVPRFLKDNLRFYFICC